MANTANVLKPRVSKSNPDYIDPHRYYELKHFCLQYPMWKKTVTSLDGLSKQPDILNSRFKHNTHGSPTERCAETRELYLRKMEFVEKAAMMADSSLYPYILKGVTEGLTYDILKARDNIPCARGTYYRAYRRFFKILSDLKE